MKYFIFFTIFNLLICTQLIGQSNGIGNNNLHETKCLPENTRDWIKQKITENRKLLKLSSNLNLKNNTVDDLSFPLELADSIPGYNDFYGISGYIDHDNTDGILDYNCSQNTYDTHKGSDFFTFPFAWYLYENDLVHVISAAEGTIVFKQDGNPDTNCSPSGEWNAVYVQHNDGSTLWYGHLKSGSLTTKSIGDEVARGEYLGVVASSGYSGDAHLHIEYYDENGNLFDPFQGNCNSLNTNSLWETQLDYINPRINAVLTHSEQPDIECGPANEISSLANEFFLNDEVYVGVYLTDYVAGSVAVTNIYQPDASLFATFNTFSNQNSYEWFWNSREYTLSDPTQKGTWRIECTLENQTVEHTFELLDNTTNVTETELNKVTIHPNPTKNIVFIEGHKTDSEFTLLNSVGKVVKKGRIEENQIFLQELAIGLYYLVITDNKNNIHLKKVLKY